MVCSLTTKLDEMEQRWDGQHKSQPMKNKTFKNHDWKPRSARQSNQEQRSQEEPTCYRCGKSGHLKIGCRAILDPKQQTSLNYKESAAAGRR